MVRVMRHSIKKNRRSSEHPGETNHISEEGLKLARKYAPVVLFGLGSDFPKYVGPEPRNKETGEAMELAEMQVEDLFDTLPMGEIKPRLPQADIIMEEQQCNIVTALFQIPKIAHVLASAGEQYRKGVLKVAQLNSSHNHIFVIAHGGSIEPAANIQIGLDELDWVDFWVKEQKIVHTIVSRHVAVR